MQVILQKTVPNLGLVGEVVQVAPGFYRNYLGPRKMALQATVGSVRQIAHQKKIIEAKTIKEKKLALELKSRIEAQPLTISHLAGEGEKLYGSITSQDIYLGLKEAGFEVDKKLIQMDAPIKTLGEHIAKVKIHPEVFADITITVQAKETKESGKNQ